MSRNVIAVVDDMFFASKIRATAESLAVALRFVKSVERLNEAAVEGKPDLIVVDLHSERVDAMSLARSIKSSGDLSSVPLLGFYSHIDTEVQRAAIEAGYNQVVPRSLFSRELPGFLRGELVKGTH